MISASRAGGGGAQQHRDASRKDDGYVRVELFEQTAGRVISRFSKRGGTRRLRTHMEWLRTHSSF